jgi:hypothetical protein
MRTFILIFFFFSTSLFGQNKYSFEYSIHLDFSNDQTTAKLDSVSGDKNTLFIDAKNQIGEKLAFGTVSVKSNDTLIQKILDENGQIKLTLKNNSYTVEVSSMDSKSYSTDLRIKDNGFKISLFAARRPQLEGYIIRSKTKLSNQDLIDIKKCLERKGNNKACEKKNKFAISIEI